MQGLQITAAMLNIYELKGKLSGGKTVVYVFALATWAQPHESCYLCAGIATVQTCQPCRPGSQDGSLGSRCELNCASVCPLDVLYHIGSESGSWQWPHGAALPRPTPLLTRYSPLIFRSKSWSRRKTPSRRLSACAPLWNVPRKPFPAGDKRKWHEEMKRYELGVKDHEPISPPTQVSVTVGDEGVGGWLTGRFKRKFGGVRRQELRKVW